MMRMPKWKVWTILGLCGLGVLLALPNLFPARTLEALPSWIPARQLNLGLDLRGGSYLLYEVDVNAVIRERATNLVESIRSALRAQRIVITSLTSDDAGTVVLRIRDLPQLDQARAAVRELDATYQMSSTPDGVITFKLDQKEIFSLSRKAVEQSIEIIRRRIDETGTKEPIIQAQGADRILIQLPGVQEPERIKALIGKTAKMTFQLVDTTVSPADLVPGRLPPGTILLPADREIEAGGRPRMYPVLRRIAVAGDRLVDAQPGHNSQTGEWVVNFRFDTLGGRQFADTTRNNVGKPFAIVLDGKVISAPVIREPILAGSGQISGSFTASSAQDLALLLRAGALPAPLKVIEERSVGPDLGADAIQAGLISCIVGFVLVVLYMGGAYGLFGWYANIALIANLVLILGAMSALQATLTLPGIAGILLTLGISVDANVLINERIREETRAGKTPIAALEAGFTRAMATIVDANLTALIKMLLLYVFGTGPVRGFAVTISLGIITSWFTATLLVRMMIGFWLRSRRPKMLPV